MTTFSRCVEALRRAGAHPSEMSRLHQVIMQVGSGPACHAPSCAFLLPALICFFSNSDEPNPRKSLQHKAVPHATGSPFVDKSVHPRHSVAFRVRRFALVDLVYMYARVDAAVKAAGAHTLQAVLCSGCEQYQFGFCYCHVLCDNA